MPGALVPLDMRRLMRKRTPNGECAYLFPTDVLGGLLEIVGIMKFM